MRTPKVARSSSTKTMKTTTREHVIAFNFCAIISQPCDLFRRVSTYSIPGIADGGWGLVQCKGCHPAGERERERESYTTAMSSIGLLALLLLAAGGSALQVSVAEVQNYTKLASWEKSSLYRVEANTDYETNPLLIHLVGSRYGEIAGITARSVNNSNI